MNGNFLSLGKLCEILQEPPAQIHKLAAAAGVEPEFTLNGIEHFSDDVIGKLKGAQMEIQTGKPGEVMIHT